MEELVKLKPELLNQTASSTPTSPSCIPRPTKIGGTIRNALSAYLERLQAFVDRLAPAHNSLKAHVLYHRLVLDRQQGKYDKEKFLAYLKLPRHVHYVNAKFLETPSTPATSRPI